MIQETGVSRTLKQCNEAKKTITGFLNVGDAVDDEMYDYFLEVLPPACNSSRCLQIGEPYSHAANGKPTFMTLVKQGEKWIYAGCITTPKGEKNLYIE